MPPKKVIVRPITNQKGIGQPLKTSLKFIRKAGAPRTAPKSPRNTI